MNTDPSSNKPTLMQRLQKRWGVTSVGQVIVILLVFSLTGSSLLYAKKPFYDLAGITPESPFWMRSLAFVFIALPLYQVLLLFFGTLLGQFRFFWEFEKKMFYRLIGRKYPAQPTEQ